MENNSNASISINLREGSIIISGSETFVEKNIQPIFDFVKNNYLPFPSMPSDAPASPPSSDISVKDNSTESETTNNKIIPTTEDDKYIKAGIYHIDPDDGSISILKRVPGNSKAEKTKNIALIVLHIRKSKVSAKDIIPICEKHACYDSSNFSATFKNEMTNFVRKGSGQNWTIELTQPGEDAALALLEEMSNDTK